MAREKIDIDLLIRIEKVVCDAYGISIRGLSTRTKKQPLPKARKTIMVIASMYQLSQRFVAKRLGVERSRVSKAKAEYYANVRDIRDREKRKELNDILAKVREGERGVKMV